MKVGDVVWCVGIGPTRIQTIPKAPGGASVIRLQTMHGIDHWARSDDLKPWGSEDERARYREELVTHLGTKYAQAFDKFLENTKENQ